MTTSINTLVSISLASILLTACAGGYSFNSNLNGEAINEYFKVGDVTLYDTNTPPPAGYRVIGLVEGYICQETAQSIPANKVDARTEARKKAADLGANGIIIQQCILTEQQDNTCFSQAMCVAKAIKTP